MRSPAIPRTVYAPVPRIPRRVAFALASALAITSTSCGSDSSGGEASSTATGGAASPSAADAPFEITQDWKSILPENKQLESYQTEEGVEAEDAALRFCEANHWLDQEGRRAPVAQEDPLVVYADGRCNYPMIDTTVGIDSAPNQQSENVTSVENGHALGVECVTTAPEGEEGGYIRDERGDISGSRKFLGVVLVQNGEVLAGYIPTVNAGFPDTSDLREC